MAAAVFARRLTAQFIAHSLHESPHDVVHAMGALQAQEPLAAQWAVALRLKSQRHVEDERVVRTHLFRGTWQLAAIEDVRWMRELVGAMELKAAETRHRGLKLDAPTFARAYKALEAGLRDGPLARAEVKQLLERARVKTDGPLLMHLLWAAELEGVIVPGPERNTHMLFDARIPAAKPRDREESLADLALRFFRTRGPATLRDWTWWSGLVAAEARKALELVKKELETDDTYYWDASSKPAKGTWLLPAFDEYLIAYANRDGVLDPKHVKKINAGGGLLAPLIVVDGRVVGTWSRTLKTKHVEVTPRFFEKRYAIEEAATAYASFLGRELKL